MQREVLVRTTGLATFVLLWAGLMFRAIPARAQDDAKKPGAAAPAKATAPAKADESPPAAGTPSTRKALRKPADAKKPSGRLPKHYKEVVTPEQREKILAIQRDYTAKIDPLRRQVEQLTKERDEKIEALLTPEQRQQLEKIKAAAKAARDAKAGAKGKKPAGGA
jgi:hypothetical protein